MTAEILPAGRSRSVPWQAECGQMEGEFARVEPRCRVRDLMLSTGSVVTTHRPARDPRPERAGRGTPRPGAGTPWLHDRLRVRWFTDPAARAIYPPEDHPHHSRVFVADLHAVAARRSRDTEVVGMTAALRRRSAEFVALWDTHDVGLRRTDHKRIVHPTLGVIELDSTVCSARTAAGASCGSRLRPVPRAPLSSSCCASSARRTWRRPRAPPAPKAASTRAESLWPPRNRPWGSPLS